MGSDIEDANRNLNREPNDIDNIKTSLSDVQGWINRIQGVVKEMSSETENPAGKSGKDVVAAYKKSEINNKG